MQGSCHRQGRCQMDRRKITLDRITARQNENKKHIKVHNSKAIQINQ